MNIPFRRIANYTAASAAADTAAIAAALLGSRVVRPRTSAQMEAGVPVPRFVFISSGSYQLGDPEVFGAESPNWSILDAVRDVLCD